LSNNGFGGNILTTKKIQRSLRIPLDLVKKVEQEGRVNERNFTKQVIFILRQAAAQKPKAKKSRAKEKVSA
jgi:hypothetical protein